MADLQFSLFGRFRVVRAENIELKFSRSLQILLAHILLQRQYPLSRDALVGLLWGDSNEKKAHKSLNTAIWRLRSILEQESVSRDAYLIFSVSGEVGFNSEYEKFLDIAVFENEVTPFLAKPIMSIKDIEAQELEKVLLLYTGELLEGFYEDWIIRERERLRLQYIKVLAILMQYYQQKELYEQSLSYGERILLIDPLREDIHRNIMRLYMANGQRALAVRQFEMCRAVLLAELNIPPMEETHRLYIEIVGSVPLLSPALSSKQANLQDVMLHFEQAKNEFNHARRELRKASRLLDQWGHEQLKK